MTSPSPEHHFVSSCALLSKDPYLDLAFVCSSEWGLGSAEMSRMRLLVSTRFRSSPFESKSMALSLSSSSSSPTRVISTSFVVIVIIVILLRRHCRQRHCHPRLHPQLCYDHLLRRHCRIRHVNRRHRRHPPHRRYRQ